MFNSVFQYSLQQQHPHDHLATSAYNVYYKILDDPLLEGQGQGSRSFEDIRSLERLCNGTTSGSTGTILSILTQDGAEDRYHGYNISDHVVNCTNFTSGLSGSEDYGYKNPLLGVLLATFAMVTICGNILVMIAVARERYLRTVTNYFIVSLAIADLIIGKYTLYFYCS